MISQVAAHGEHQAAGYVLPQNATGTFTYWSYPGMEHYQDGYPGTATNNNPQLLNQVFQWIEGKK